MIPGLLRYGMSCLFTSNIATLLTFYRIRH
jgi:hypothetical protein